MAHVAIRYDSAHRDLIYLLISLFSFFFFIIIIANLFVKRRGKVASAAVVPVVVVSLRNTKVSVACGSHQVKS